MPHYTFQCGTCGCRIEKVRHMKDAARPIRCRCGKTMRRDLRADAPGIVTDPDITQADIDRYIDQRHEIQERAAAGQALIDCDRPRLSRSLARVPGVNRIMGKDGRPYAVFRNEADRKATYKRLGLQEGD